MGRKIILSFISLHPSSEFVGTHQRKPQKFHLPKSLSILQSLSPYFPLSLSGTGRQQPSARTSAGCAGGRPRWWCAVASGCVGRSFSFPLSLDFLFLIHSSLFYGDGRPWHRQQSGGATTSKRRSMVREFSW